MPADFLRPLARLTALLAALCAFSAPVAACEDAVSICGEAGAGSFALLVDGAPATIYVDAAADSAVSRVAGDFAKDIGRVSGTPAAVTNDLPALSGPAVIIGVLGQSAALDALVAAGKLDVAGLAGEWEGYRQQVVERPFPNVSRALVIVGSDRRGAVFGTYDLSAKIGVSPWYWWADVPAVQRETLYVTAGSQRDAPEVRYRGFFINDEDPALSGWAQKRFGGVNSAMYEPMFELLLRLKGNYMWPAMWGKAFHVDDPVNTALADSMGVVMGTSHHEPLTRAQAEWNGQEMGHWDYATNGDTLRKFWRGGIERMVTKCGDHPCDSLITVGMRGDGDEAMSEGTAIGLLETIVADQRAIIADVTGKPAGETPQVWALYKEVQDYYDKDMRVPDDVTLLFADDNWGQIRRLPQQGAAPRAGGYGVYYHFDYVGGPRSYKWLNANQVEKTWQQMDLAWQSGARDLWIVNVGDLKPMEYPLDFFMQQAWDPEAMTPAALAAYPRSFAEQSFGPRYADAIADLLVQHGKLAARRKPELVGPDSFALGEGAGKLLDGGEFGAMVDDWRRLVRRAEAIRSRLPAGQHDAFFELVGHPIRAMTNLYELYYAAAWNRRLAGLGDPRANSFADEVERLFERDKQITAEYHALRGGKWDGMINQTHIGYTNWDDPDVDVMPQIRRVATTGPVPAVRFKHAKRGSAKASAAAYSIEALDFDRSFAGNGIEWTAIGDLGRTAGAVVALPQGRAASAAEDGIRLEYDVRLAGGDTRVALQMAPTIDTQASGGIRIGVSLDDGPVRVLVSTLQATGVAPINQDEADWEEAVRNNAHGLETRFADVTPGRHVLKIWRISDNAVLQRISVGEDDGRYLGPLPHGTTHR